MNPVAGDEVRMADLRNGEVIDVVVIEWNGDKVVVEDAHGPKPRRRWLTGAGFLSPREVQS